MGAWFSFQQTIGFHLRHICYKQLKGGQVSVKRGESEPFPPDTFPGLEDQDSQRGSWRGGGVDWGAEAGGGKRCLVSQEADRLCCVCVAQ